MENENSNNSESEPSVGKPILGPKRLKEVGKWIEMNGKLRQSLDEIPLTAEQKKVLETLSDAAARQQMLEWAEEYKMQNE